MPLADQGKLAHSDWYGHVLGTGDDPSLLARRYRPHGHRDELSRSKPKLTPRCGSSLFAVRRRVPGSGCGLGVLPAGFAGLHLATGDLGGPGPGGEPFAHERDLAWPEPVSGECLVVDVVELLAGVGEVTQRTPRRAARPPLRRRLPPRRVPDR
jgi:hypothetical protein